MALNLIRLAQGLQVCCGLWRDPISEGHDFIVGLEHSYESPMIVAICSDMKYTLLPSRFRVALIARANSVSDRRLILSPSSERLKIFAN
jgi:phosphopantetheine adenylyltransferase